MVFGDSSEIQNAVVCGAQQRHAQVHTSETRLMFLMCMF